MSEESDTEDEDLSAPVNTKHVNQPIRILSDDSQSEDEELCVTLPSTSNRSKYTETLRLFDASEARRIDISAETASSSLLDRKSHLPEVDGGDSVLASESEQSESEGNEGHISLSDNAHHEPPSSDRGGSNLEKPLFDGDPINPKRDILLGIDGDSTKLPGCTAQWLRPYQIDGILFMYDLYTTRKGGILGDDMGLGKTVQVIAFLNAVFGKTASYATDWKRMREMRLMGEEYPVVMILCPGTLIDNWLRELETWSWTHVAVFHGPDKDAAWQSIRNGRSEILITTYNTYKTNMDRLNQLSWDVVVADECHIIKEKKSQITQAVNQVNSRCRIGLTGTAIQNNYDELYTLLDWTNPGAFGTASQWTRQVSTVLKNGQKHTATNVELTLARKKATELSKNLLPRVLLRRTKALIAHQLPKKTDKVVFCPLTPLQITAYDNLMRLEEVTFLRDAKKPCPCASELPRQLCCHAVSPSGKAFAELLFPYLHYLRNLSNHMALCLPRPSDPAWEQARTQELLEEALPAHWKTLSQRTPMLNGCDAELCGKWKILQKLLVHWKRDGAKVLLFSSSVKLLDMLNDLMMQENYLYEYLHGSMSLEARSAAVKNFNENKEQFVFLISTRAGGVGLNIVSANKVVIFDPNWNPAHDLQAQDRAYRIGQRRDVEVYRLISTGTVEEVVYARQVYKQQQANIGYEASEERRYFRGVQGDSDQRGELFGVENLLTFHGENLVLKAIFDGTEQAESEFNDIRMASVDINATQENIETIDAKDALGISAIVRAQCQNDVNEDDKSRVEEDAVARILASAGVSYSRKNNEIVGGSAIEMEISKVAARAANDANHSNRQAYLATILKTKKRQMPLEHDVECVGTSEVLRKKQDTGEKKRILPWMAKK